MSELKKIRPAPIETDFEFQPSLPSIHIPESEPEPETHAAPPKSSCKSKIYTLTVILFVGICTAADVGFQCFLSLRRSSKLTWQIYLVFAFVSLALVAFLRAILAKPQRFLDFDFMVAESLFEQIVHKKVLNCKSEDKKLQIARDMRFQDNEQMLMQVLRHSKHFNSRVAKIRALIDGYHRGGDDSMPM